MCSTTVGAADMEQNGLDFLKTVKATLLPERPPGYVGTDLHPWRKYLWQEGRSPARPVSGLPFMGIRQPARSWLEAPLCCLVCVKCSLPAEVCMEVLGSIGKVDAFLVESPQFWY